MTSINGFTSFAAELEEFADDLEDIADDVQDEAVDRGVGRTALQVENSASRAAPVDTGDLRADIKALKLSTALWSVGTTKEYAPPTEYGSKPHPITPTDAEALHFFWEGEEHFRQLVNHPGTPAQPFLRPALNRHRTDLVKNIQNEIEKLVDSHL